MMDVYSTSGSWDGSEAASRGKPWQKCVPAFASSWLCSSQVSALQDKRLTPCSPRLGMPRCYASLPYNSLHYSLCKTLHQYVAIGAANTDNLDLGRCLPPLALISITVPAQGLGELMSALFTLFLTWQVRRRCQATLPMTCEDCTNSRDPVHC